MTAKKARGRKKLGPRRSIQVKWDEGKYNDLLSILGTKQAVGNKVRRFLDLLHFQQTNPGSPNQHDQVTKMLKLLFEK